MIIETKNLSFAYGERKILKNIDFRAKEGELVAVLGPNGAGKSTLFRCMLKLLKGYDGQIEIGGRDTRTMSAVEIARKIAYIPQNASPIFNYTVEDTVLMGTTSGLGLLQMPGEEQREATYKALGMLGIEKLAGRGINRISGGERQLAMIARAMVQKAKIIIMDEPTANLDYGNQMRVMEMISTLGKEGYTLVMSTHNPEQALLFADTAFTLKDGRVLSHGDADKVLNDEIMESLYSVDVRIYDHQIEGRKVRTCVPLGYRHH
ncbi:MAG: ABC transporter ATP-binding protein [Anaerovoracaceae bacterium]